MLRTIDHRVWISMSYLVLKKAQNALEELLKCLFLVLHRIDKVMELIDVCLETIDTDFFHLNKN